MTGFWSWALASHNRFFDASRQYGIYQWLRPLWYYQWAADRLVTCKQREYYLVSAVSIGWCSLLPSTLLQQIYGAVFTVTSVVSWSLKGFTRDMFRDTLNTIYCQSGNDQRLLMGTLSFQKDQTYIHQTHFLSSSLEKYCDLCLYPANMFPYVWRVWYVGWVVAMYLILVDRSPLVLSKHLFCKCNTSTYLWCTFNTVLYYPQRWVVWAAFLTLSVLHSFSSLKLPYLSFYY